MPASGRRNRPGGAGIDWWAPLAGRFDLPAEPVFGRFDPAEPLHRLCALGHLSPRAYATLVAAAARTHGVDVSRLTIPETLDLFGDPQRCTSALLRSVLAGLLALRDLPGAVPVERPPDPRRAALREAFEAAARQRRLERRAYLDRFVAGVSIERIAADGSLKPAVVARRIRGEIDRIILYNGLESLLRGPWSAPLAGPRSSRAPADAGSAPDDFDPPGPAAGGS